MNSTVEKFNQKIEELKKRLKAISTSQNILSKLNALEDYFKQIQDYLNSINTSFSDHITQSEDYSENIATLQSQIADVQQQIQNLPDLEDLNLTQMQADISTLQNDLSTLKGSSNSSISNLESQIATIQADISTITAQIPTLQSNISKNSSDISTLKTTTQNQATTINNLTASNSNLALTVSEINEKTTSFENTINNLSERTCALESDYDAPKRIVDKRNLIFHLNSDSTPVKSRIYYYSAKENTYVKQNFTLNYSSVANGILNISLFENGTKVLTKTYDLSQYPESASFEFLLRTTDINQTFQIEVSSSTHVVYSTLTCIFEGINVLLEENDITFKMRFGKQTAYGTRYSGSVIEYGFYPEFQFDASKLIKWQYDDSLDEIKIRYAVCAPRFEMTDTNRIGTIFPALICEKTDGNLYVYDINEETGELSLYYIYSNIETCKTIETTLRGEPTFPACINNTPTIKTYVKNQPTEFVLNPEINSKWINLIVSSNYSSSENSYPANANEIQMLGLNQDGYFYSIVGIDSRTQTHKIAKGERCWCSYGNGKDSYAFIDNGKDIEVYIIKNAEVTKKATLSGCDFVYLGSQLHVYYQKNGEITRIALNSL